MSDKQKYTEKYWQEELRRSEQDQDDKQFTSHADESIKVYESEKTLEDNGRKLNIWWATIQTILPAYYAQEPKVEATLKKKRGDDLAVKGAVVAERGTQYELDEEMNFDEVVSLGLLDYLLVGRGALKTRYEASVEGKDVDFLVYSEGKGYVDSAGKPYEGEITTGDDGSCYGCEESAEKKGERAFISRIHWRDYREQVGRMPSEIGWKADRAYMGREEVTKVFGKDFAAKLKYECYPEDVKKGKTTNVYEGRAELWEIHCRESNKTYWFSGAGIDTVLEPSDPPLHFQDFYPYEVLGQNRRLNSTIPICDYTLLRDQILEVERFTTRIHATLQAARANGVYDAALGDAPEKLFRGDLKLYPVKFPGYKGEQQLSRSIEWLPIDPLIKLLDVLIQGREMACAKIAEQVGASDLIRGNADPTMTATQAMTENSRANWRFEFRKKHINDWIGRAVGKLGEVICERFSPETLYEISNASDLIQMPDQTGAMRPDMEQWAAICAFLKSEPGRRYKVSIATDSMNASDQAQEHKDRTDLITSTGSFLGQMDGIIQQHPSMAPVALELMRYVTRSYKAGKDLEPTFQQALQSIAQEVQQKASQPPPGAADSQAKMQIAQMQAQAEQTLAQIKIQSEQAIVQLVESNKKAIADLGAQVEMYKINAAGAQSSNQAQVDMAINQQKAEHQAAIERIQQGADTQVALLNAQIAKDKMQMETHIKAVEASFGMAIEQRKAETEQLKMLHSMSQKKEEKPQMAAAPAAAPVIHVHIPKGGKRTGTIQDSNGATKTITVEDAD